MTSEYNREKNCLLYYGGIIISVVSLFIIAGFAAFPAFIAKFNSDSNIYSRTYDLKKFPINCTNKVCRANISELGLTTLSDDEQHVSRSPLLLYENGNLLSPHASQDDIQKEKPGVFSHWREKSGSYWTPANATQYTNSILFVPQNFPIENNKYNLTIPASVADAYSVSLFINSCYKTEVVTYSLMLFAVGVFLIIRYIGIRHHLTYQIPLLLSMAGCYYLFLCVAVLDSQYCRPPGAYTYFNLFAISPDSSTYYNTWTPSSVRPPLYPLFVKTFAKKYTYDEVCKTTSVGYWIQDEAHPLKRVSQVQIVLLYTAGLLFFFTLMHYLKSPVPAMAAILFHYFHFYAWEELNNILTEPLTQCFVFICLALFVIILHSKRKLPIVLLSVFVALSFLIRAASIYLCIFFIAASATSLLKDYKYYYKTILISLCLIVFIVKSPAIYSKLNGLGSPDESISYMYVLVHALRLADTNDISLMPDEETRLWLDEAIKLRDIKDAYYDSQFKDNPYLKLIYRLQSAYDVFSTNRKTLLKPLRFYYKVSTPILKNHFAEYLATTFDLWWITITSQTTDRITPLFVKYKIELHHIFYFIIFGIIVLRNKISYISISLLSAHYLHILICCMFSAPVYRLIYATDGLIFLTLALIIAGLFSKLVHFHWFGKWPWNSLPKGA